MQYIENYYCIKVLMEENYIYNKMQVDWYTKEV
jgi:hypothetical protein